jgi:hypothetical protein
MSAACIGWRLLAVADVTLRGVSADNDGPSRAAWRTCLVRGGP